MSAALDLAKEVLADWDKASEPNADNTHNGGGFALDNWRGIRVALRAVVLELEDAR